MWRRFWQNCQQDLKFWLYLMLLQTLGRSGFIFALKNYIGSSATISDYVLACSMGLRFDAVWATIATFVPLLLVSLPSVFSQRYSTTKFALNLRWVLASICTIIIAGIYIGSIEYYVEYHDNFNQFLFGLVYDDTKAILQTILAQDYIVKYCLIFLAVIIVSGWLAKKLLRQHATQNYQAPSLILKCLIVCAIITFYYGAFRGGYGPRPMQLKDAATVKDPFLSKAVIPPFSALKYALQQRSLIQQNDYGQQFLVNNNVLDLLTAKFPQEAANDFDGYLQRTATGWAQNAGIPRAKHIFVIVGESYDAWALQPDYASLKLTNQLQQIAKQGISVQNFLPAADGTVAALNTIFAGLLETEVMINYQPNSVHAYPTATALHFKNLGYKTNFFYGGYLSWQKIGDLAAAQGFDNVYGAAHMATWAHTTEWGVDDHELYAFILQTVADDAPSYNVIMTTSNHPPYRVELQKHGCDLAYITQQLKKYPDSPTSARQLAHLWYADKTLGDFVRTAENKFALTLFAITGDHYGRRHVLPNPPLREIAMVPLVLYGKGITNKIKFDPHLAGSHLDIGPTLVELTAPQGFKYHALGNNLFAQTTPTHAMNKNFILSLDNVTMASNAVAELQSKHAQLMGLSWWRVVKGNKLNH